MKDRVPVNPGRVLVTPENGNAAFYATMTRADNPTQEGTPLNKNTLLKDATAALFGLGADAVPDDVLAAIKSLFNSQASDIASKPKVVTGRYTGTGTYGASNPCSLTFDFSPKLVLLYSPITSYSNRPSNVVMIHNAPTAKAPYDDGSGYATLQLAWAALEIKWYSTNDVHCQFNDSGRTYYYCALG